MSLAKRAMELPNSSPLRKEILDFLAGEKTSKAIYIGKSKKILSKEVIVIKKMETKSRVRDMEGNEALVLNSQLQFNI